MKRLTVSLCLLLVLVSAARVRAQCSGSPTPSATPTFAATPTPSATPTPASSLLSIYWDSGWYYYGNNEYYRHWIAQNKTQSPVSFTMSFGGVNASDFVFVVPPSCDPVGVTLAPNKGCTIYIEDDVAGDTGSVVVLTNGDDPGSPYVLPLNAVP